MLPCDPDTLFRELHSLQSRLTLSSITEAIRLLKSDKFSRLTDRDVRDVANYRAIEIDDEPFFHKAFSAGKEVAANLAFAATLGRHAILEDLQRLHATVTGSPVAAG